MPTLREIQTAVHAALWAGPLDRAADPATAWVMDPATDMALLALNASGKAGASRLGIYRNNLRENFSRALRLTFPVVHRLVGADYFRQTAKSFQHRCPSRSGDLQQAGKSFPDYLGELHRTDRFRYLGDVARLEWLIQESSLAADHAPLNLELLAGVDPSQYESLEFTLHPALRMFESPFPAHAIWESNVAEGEDPPEIDLTSGSDRLAILRRRSHIEFLRLSEGELAFLRSFHAGMNFGAALACGLTADAHFDASTSLQRFVAAEAVVDFSTT